MDQNGKNVITDNNNELVSMIQCINILINAVEQGQKSGAYSLAEASKIVEAIKYIKLELQEQD